ncbi:hypothetical protein GCM10009557_18070 [Virgisporangium ochraceum]|uniref:Uncharacterized protein n=1 Tax=Virgisporangium ochraceum TaxID=65505 RepID=A0A8J4EG83_9ACTN|nr:hypothetical protein Voc01_083980 [Virgisporangium ochraceum]
MFRARGPTKPTDGPRRGPGGRGAAALARVTVRTVVISGTRDQRFGDVPARAAAAPTAPTAPSETLAPGRAARGRAVVDACVDLALVAASICVNVAF